MRMLKRIAALFTPARRRWLYGIAVATIPLGIQQEWFTEQTAVLIPPLVMAILNVKNPQAEYRID